MILFDGKGHLTSDTSFEELYEFRKKHHIKGNWIQISNSGIIYYDLWGKKVRGIKVNCTTRDIIKRGIRDNPDD